MHVGTGTILKRGQDTITNLNNKVYKTKENRRIQWLSCYSYTSFKIRTCMRWLINNTWIDFNLVACEVDHGTLYLFNILLNYSIYWLYNIYLVLNTFILKLRQNTLWHIHDVRSQPRIVPRTVSNIIARVLCLQMGLQILETGQVECREM